MAKKPEPTKPISWNVYKIVNKAIRFVTIDAPDEANAIEKAEAEFKAPAELDGYTAMTRRKDEIKRDGLNRKWPHHVALPAEWVRDPLNREVIFCAAGVLSATPFTYPLRRDDSEYVVFCFAKANDAEAFAKRFGGIGCLRVGDNPEKRAGWPERVVQDERRVQNVGSDQ